MRNFWMLFVVFSGCSAVPQAPVTDANNRVVDIVNTTDTALQFSAVRAENKMRGRLETLAEVIAPNYYKTLDFDDGSGACLFAFQAEFQDGRPRRTERVNTCEVASWVVN